MNLRRLLAHPWTQASLCAGTSFAVYVRTLAPTIMWYDMGEFATAAYVLGIAHNTGYPLYMLLGKLFTLLPVGDVAYRVNLMSAVFAALTVLVMYWIVYHLTTNTAASLVAALTIAFTSTLWSNATWAESYDLNAFLTLLILFLILRWFATGRRRLMYLASLTFGLSLGNHHLVLVVGPVILYLIWRRWRRGELGLSWRNFLLLGGLFLLGFSVNLYLPLRAATDPPVNWGDPSDLNRFVQMIVTGMASRDTFVNPFETVFRAFYGLTILWIFPRHEFGLAGLILVGFGGIMLLRRRKDEFVVTGLVIFLTAVMISIYGIHNIFNYFQPIYLMGGIWIGSGAAEVVDYAGGRLAQARWLRGTLLTRSRRIILATLLLLCIPLLLFSGNFRRLDRSQNRGASDFAHYMFSSVERGSVILADFWSWTPLLYAQVVEGQGEGVGISAALSIPGLDQQETIDSLLSAGAPVYVAVGIEDSPRLEVGSRRLQLVAPRVIQYYPTHAVPLPEFKDILVPEGAVYKAVSSPPNLAVEGVPDGVRIDAHFEGGLSLVGFAIDPIRIRRGESFRASYYWMQGETTNEDHWVDILFTDEAGNLRTRMGLPVWLHSHWVGGGTNPTSRWEAGRIMRETYDGVVPSSVPPGTYWIRAFLYRDPSRADRVDLMGVATDEGAVLGTITVLPDP